MLTFSGDFIFKDLKGKQFSPFPSHVPSQALLKLNRKLQPMVDGMEANRNKWQDLHLSYQQTRRASLSSPSADSVQSPESQENAKASQHLGSAETLKQCQDSKCSPEAEWMRLPVWPVPDDDTSLIHRSTSGWLSHTGLSTEWQRPLRTLCYLNTIYKNEIRCAHYLSKESLC